MPTFLDPVNGLSLSEALVELAIAANADNLRLCAYELWHPSMTVPIRIVNDTEPLTATLEDDAPRNAGESVFHIACDIDVDAVDENGDAGTGEREFRVDAVTGDIKDALDLANAALDAAVRDAPWQIIERVYLLSDTSAPHVRPVFKCTAVRVTLQGDRAVFAAAYRASANTAIPAITFTPESYPTLAI